MFDRSYRQIGDVSKPYPQYVFKPDKTSPVHYLGGGAFGEVFKGFALERNNAPVAVKKIQLKTLKKGANEQIKHSVDKEIEAFKKLKGKMKCKNLLQIFDVLRSTNNLYIVMEYCRHGDLSGFLKKKKRLTETEATEVLSQTINGLKYMHQINMLHRDIKPANILIDNGVYKLCDYGLSSVAIANPHSMQYLSSVGSPLYAAPEILIGKDYNSSIDVFSTGVMVYEAIFGFTPWPAKTLPQLVEKQKKHGVIKFPRHPEISQELKNILTHMCLVDKFKRPTIQQLIKTKDWQKLVNKEQEFNKRMQGEKSVVMQSVMLFNHQARNQGQHGQVNKKVKENIEKIVKDKSLVMQSSQENLQKQQPYKKQQKVYQQEEIQKQTMDKMKQNDQQALNQFNKQASKINKLNHANEYLKNQFDNINKIIEFDILKVQITNQAIESFQTSQFYFKEIKKYYKSYITFALAKFQCLKLMNLKKQLSCKVNLYKLDQSLWGNYLGSSQYQTILEAVNYQSKLSYYILQKIYQTQAQNFNEYYNNNDKSFLTKVKIIFNKNVSDMTDCPLVFQTIKGLVGYILNEIQTEMIMQQTYDEGIWKQKLIASTYLLYVVMYEEYYSFNPKNQITFSEVIELVERYGVQQLCSNLQKRITQYNSAQQ